MRDDRPRLVWAAPLLVGTSAAIAAEVAIGILLYAGPGLMRSLTTVLAVEGGALAVGLWQAPPSGAQIVERLRRRWLFCLAAFVGASFFGLSWSVVQDLGGGPAGQGLGLAVLAALPLYGCGLVLGGMAAVARDDSAGGLPGPGPAAALGAALGFVITGTLLPRAPIPASLLVVCLVLLSAGGMIYGAVLARRPVVHLRATRPGAGAEVRVEDRRGMPEAGAARYLLESGHVRRRELLDRSGTDPWDVAVARSLIGDGGNRRVLMVGGGASALPSAITKEHPDVSVEVLERNPAVVELARDHFETGLDGDAGDRIRVRVGNLEDLVRESSGPFDLVVIDTSALEAIGGANGLSRAARSALVEALATDGALATGPVALGGWPLDAHPDWRTTSLRRSDGGAETLSVLWRSTEPHVPGFVSGNGGEPNP